MSSEDFGINTIEKLKDSESYQLWKFQVTIFFKAHGLYGLLEESKNPEIKDFEKKDAQAQKIIIQTVDKMLLTQLLTCKSAAEMYKRICEIFDGSENRKKGQLMQNFFNYKFDNAVDMQNNLAQIESIVYRLKQLQQAIDDEMVVSRILSALPHRYDYFITAWESTPNEEKNLKNLTSRLIKEEEKQNQSKEDVPVAFKTSVNKSQKPKSNSGTNNNKTCYRCHQSGHISKDHCSICKKLNHKEENCYFRNKHRDNQTGKNKLAFLTYKNENVSNSTKFIVDSGCTSHMVSDKTLLKNVIHTKTNISVAKKSETMQSECQGEFIGKDCILKNTLHVTQLATNLLSVSAITESGGEVLFKKKSVEVFKDKQRIFSGEKEDSGLYTVNMIKENDKYSLMTQKRETALDWHKKMGHPSLKVLKMLPEVADGVKLQKVDDLPKNCETCIAAKQNRLPFKNQRTQATRLLERIHTDVCGPLENDTWDGKKYILTLLDDYSHFIKIYLLKNKHEVSECLKNYIQESENEKSMKVSCIRCDNGGEYTGEELKRWCFNKGIKLDYTVAYTPQLNGKAERLNRTILEKARALLFNSKINKNMWGEAVYCAAYLLNRLPTETIKFKTPYEIWNGRRPDLSNIREFGCEAFCKNLGNIKKLDPRTQKLIMVGYSTSGYRLFDSVRRKIVYARDVIFETKEENTELEALKLLRDVQFYERDSEESDEDSETQENNTPILTEPETIEDEEKNETIEDEEMRKRDRRLPARLQDYVLLTFHEAITGPEKEQWKHAIKEELNSLEKNKTWKLVDKNEVNGQKILTNRWVFRVKEDGTYKARLVVRGNEQREYMDFEEVFSPVASQSSLKALFAIAASRNYHLMTFDVKTAFLYGELEDYVYMKVPQGLEEKGEKICRLEKSLYGLRQAPKQWNKKFIEIMKEIGFEQIKNELCVLKNKDASIILAIYVDDGLIIGKEKAEILKFLKKLNKLLEIKIYEDPKTYLGMEIKKNEYGIWLIQDEYTKNILEKYNMKNCKPATTPCTTDDVREVSERETKFPYREAIGSLLYLSTRTRPDIAHAVGLASRHMEDPNTHNVASVKRIFRYLAGTLGEGICFKRNSDLSVIKVYCDADYAGDCETRRSTTGYVIMLAEGPISWCSRRQPIVALSSTEAEFISAAECCKEVVFLKSLLENLNVSINAVFNIDNQSAIQLIKTGVFNKRSKHIDVRFHYIHDLYINNEIEVTYCPTDDQSADILTKPLNKIKFLKHKSFLINTVK